MSEKVFVSGCFDMVHSGHIEFFREAARYGDLYVAIGSDKTVYEIKGRPPIMSEQERLFMIQSVAFVKEAFISRGSGLLDFIDEIERVKPDYLVVNEDGNIPEKHKLCERMGIRLIILKREPYAGLQARTSADLRMIDRMPYRIDVAGGWLDQPWVSSLYSGAVITISLEPTIEFNHRSGMATSTRRKAIDLWGNQLPAGDPYKLSKILFCYDNPPGTKEVSGAQDSIGICIPGANKSWYGGEYWPSRIDSINDELTMQFIEQSLNLIPLGQRDSGYSVLSDTNITPEGAKALSDATEDCWEAIKVKDLTRFGRGVRMSFEAQIAMFPHMVNPMIHELIDQYSSQALGWKLSGAGGGGYLILVAEKPIENAVRVIIRRRED